MESLVEGVFGRAFRRQIHPVEIAKALTKQMDEGRMVSISRTYAPNDFTVHLSEEDVESIRAYQAALRDELIQYASTHAENKDYHLMTPPRVRFGTEEVGLGKDQGTSAISAEEAQKHGLAREVVEVVTKHGNFPLKGRGPWTVGRSQENDIVIPDPNVSRQHARLSRSDNGYVVEDLGSTNGTLLGGAPIDRERIESGDELTFGQSSARFVRRIEPPGEGGRDPAGPGGR